MDIGYLTAEEQKNLDVLLEHSSWVPRFELARQLLELSSGSLRLAPQKDYLALQPSDGTKPNTRNAVSVVREGTLFTVSDWSPLQEATTRGLTARQVSPNKIKIRRLLFSKLELSSVEAHLPFFSKLVEASSQLILKRPY